ncbi:hypothetical protein L2E82_50602 [Cichorium intybus]|nr:hypothetical protein L2E82_50602 [Cichorium intybus]
MDEEDEFHYRPPILQSFCFGAVSSPPAAMMVDSDMWNSIRKKIARGRGLGRRPIKVSEILVVQLQKQEGKIEPSPPPLFDRKVHCSISKSIVRSEGLDLLIRLAVPGGVLAS